jgi:hypothetical protein
MREENMKKGVVCLVLMVTGFSLPGCLLDITSFQAPATGNTGEYLVLEFEGAGEDMPSVERSTYGLALQLPAGWVVAKARAVAVPQSAFARHYTLVRNPDYESAFTPESGHTVWVGTAEEGGADDRDLAATVWVLPADFSGTVGATQGFTLKAAAGGMDCPGWTTDDPANELNFADITQDPYVESIIVTQSAADAVPPPAITETELAGSFYDECEDHVRLTWPDYDMEAAGDVAAFNIYRDNAVFANVSAMTPLAVDTSGGLSYEDDTASANSEYYYAVTPVDEAGNEDPNVTAVRITTYDYTHEEIQQFDVGLDQTVGMPEVLRGLQVLSNKRPRP